MEAIVKAKKIGGSIAVVIPKKLVERENIRPDDMIELRIERKDNLNSLWGTLKDVKIPTQKIMDITDEGEDFD